MSALPPDPVIEMRHLRLVAAIGEHGSVTAAARHLHLTQPALSHQLRELESRLRTPLFVRTARRMVATPAGLKLLDMSRSVLADVQTYERQITQGEFSSACGTIRIATECYTCYHWLPPVLREFAKRWPAVDLRIAPEYTSTPTTAVREGALDIAIVHRVTAHRQIQFDPLFDDELVVVVPTGHRLARRPFVTAEDFTDEHLIVYSTPADRIAILHDVLEPAGVVPARLTRIQLTEAIVQLVSAGFGVSVLARWAALPWIRSGELQAVRLTERGYARHWFVATRREQPAPAYQFDLMELLRRQLAGGPLPRIA